MPLSRARVAIRSFVAGVGYARALLTHRIDLASCERDVRSRMRGRADAFLTMARTAIFGWEDSPYRALFASAGLGWDDLARSVGAHGVEGALGRLAAAGVYVGIDEYKGKREIVRRGLTLRVTEESFGNPNVRSGLVASSGGTRSRGIPTTISATNHRMGAEHLALALEAYEVATAPAAVWLPYAHGASLWAVLALAAAGRPPACWFTQLPAQGHRDGRYARLLGIRAAAAGLGLRLPTARHVPVGGEVVILDWLRARERETACAIFTTPSCALRLALAAERSGRSLAGVSFVTIAEPLTPTKLAAIRRAGARAFSSLGLTEFGRVTYGCAQAAADDDGHVCRDVAALVERPRVVDRLGTEVPALLLTAIQPDARKVLLNMETGDYAALTTRACGCRLDGLGWSLHLDSIRSFEKLNAEGRLFFGSQLIELIEQMLPRRFGGDPTDYQLVEQEDAEGFTRLSLYVHPRLGALDDGALLRCVEDALALRHEVNTRVWSEAGTVNVRRAEPIMTGAGKLMPLHHLRAEHPAPAAGA